MDNPFFKFVTLSDIIELYQKTISISKEIYVFVDEIQYSNDWDKWLKVLYDTNHDIHVIATGSASPIILKGVAESGTGRWITINVPTLSFYEYCLLKNIKISNDLPLISDIKNMNKTTFYDLMMHLNDLQRDFTRYITIGGFPELVLANDDKYAQRILREDIVDKVLKRDLPELYKIRNISLLEKIFLYLCMNSSDIINYSTMSQVMENTTLPTIQEYIRYLESANLIYLNEPFRIKWEKCIKIETKNLYCRCGNS